MAADNGELRVRLDKWLWAARFFKTRALATEAIAGGKVHVNGERCKPSRKIGTGDQLLITRGIEVFDVVVEGVNDKRRPAREAVLLYKESEESLARREEEREMRRLASSGFRDNVGKPDKHQRRELRKFKGRT